MRYNWHNIHNLLTDGFTDQELRIFCYDAPGFGPAYDRLSADTETAQLIELLVRHAYQSQQLEALLEWAKTHHPAAYEEHQPYVYPGLGPEVSDAPYRGLQVFEEQHASFFFGREQWIERLLDKLRLMIRAQASGRDQPENRFLVIVGPSGSGKSSLARAGLVPALRRGDLPGSDDWPLCIFKPGQRPLESLAVTLSQLVNAQPDPAALLKLVAGLETDQRQLHLAAQLALTAAAASRYALLLVDQFEEIFTLCQDETRRRAFVANLLYASAVAGGRTVIVLTMRADFYGKCAAYPDLAARITEHQLLIGPMTEAELRQAIEGPAELVGLTFEGGLVDILLHEVQAEPGALPLLQHTLLELWERRQEFRLTFAAYHEIGGIQGAIAHRAESIYASFDPQQQAITRRTMLRLTQPGEGTEDTRRRAALTELLPAEGQVADVDAVVQALADARLLTTSKDEQNNEIVDVAHEALIRSWPRLRGWIDEDRDALRTHRRLTEAASEWEGNTRDESYLYRGARLATAEEWVKKHGKEMSNLECEFLEASLAERNRREQEAEEQRRRELQSAQQVAQAQASATRRLLWLVGLVSVLALIYPSVLIYRQVLRRLASGEMAHIDGGQALIGSQNVQVNLLDFEIERFEVTNRQYRLCVKAGACTEPRDMGAYKSHELADYPVVLVTAFQAAAYCHWLGRRLPFEAEWEWAAQGPEERPWPWGQEAPDTEHLNVIIEIDEETSLHTVFSHPLGATPNQQVFNLAGNVMEWTASLYLAYPADLDQTWDGKPENAPKELVVRGGSWRTDLQSARPTQRLNAAPSAVRQDLGFRCAR